MRTGEKWVATVQCWRQRHLILDGVLAHWSTQFSKSKGAIFGTLFERTMCVHACIEYVLSEMLFQTQFPFQQRWENRVKYAWHMCAWTVEFVPVFDQNSGWNTPPAPPRVVLINKSTGARSASSFICARTPCRNILVCFDTKYTRQQTCVCRMMKCPDERTSAFYLNTKHSLEPFILNIYCKSLTVKHYRTTASQNSDTQIRRLCVGNICVTNSHCVVFCFFACWRGCCCPN